uniref:Structure-specific endonuclease subunit SLX1 homolog n=1 Tax=Panagrolaimus sp. JU765 TaxID=591449 RepID=A0AC34QPW6_9BILA
MADSFDDEDNEISWLNGQSSSPKKLSPIKSLSPALARRPPEIDLSTQKLPIQNQQKRSKKLIPENVPFSELNDEVGFHFF